MWYNGIMNRSQLEQVLNDNIRDHQIGGITDGMTPEQASDIGFDTPATIEETLKNISERKVAIARSLGGVVCGDCGKVFPCPHGDGKQTFGN